MRIKGTFCSLLGGLLLLGGLSASCQPSCPPLTKTGDSSSLSTAPFSERFSTVIQRPHYTPSGDWSLELEYGYDDSGRLAGIHWKYGAINGYDAARDDFFPTYCERIYEVSPAGKLTMTSETIQDATTGEIAKRSFYDPPVEHWMTLEEAKRESIKADE